MKYTVEALWDKFQEGVNYKSIKDIYDTVKENEKFYAGDQWDKTKAKSLPRNTFNFIEQLVDVKVSTVKSQEVKINRMADENDGEGSKADEAAKILTLMDEKNFERLKMSDKNEKTLLTCALSGLGGTFWFWDDDIEMGNEFRVKGDFNCEQIDASDLYVSNPCENDIQKQDLIQIPMKKTVKQVKEMAKKYGVSEEDISKIQPNELTGNEAYDEEVIKKDEKNIVTLLMNMWKKDKKVMCKFTTKEVTIRKEYNTELTRYPIAFMNWKERKKYIFGTAEVTYIKDNQRNANTLASLRALVAKLSGVPITLYNKNLIHGLTNQAGGIYGVDAPRNMDIGGAIQHKQPTATTIDFDKAINDTIELTKTLKGVNDNITGASRPENRGALLLQQQAAGVPIESIRRRFKQYIEDVALIWLDFYQNKYNLTRKLAGKDKQTQEFVGTDYKDLILNTKVDIGDNTQFSDAISIEILDKWLESDKISFIEYLERIPKNLVPKTQELIETRKEQEESNAQAQQQFMAQLPPDIQQMIQQEENGEQMLQELMQMQSQELQQAILQLRGEEVAGNQMQQV